MRRFYLDHERTNDSGSGLVALLLLGWLITIVSPIIGFVSGYRLLFAIIILGLLMIFLARGFESKIKNTFNSDFVAFAKDNGFNPLSARGYLSVVDWDAIQVSAEKLAELDKNDYA